MSPTQPDSVNHGRLAQHALVMTGSHTNRVYCTYLHCNMQLTEPTKPTGRIDHTKSLVQEAQADGACSQASQGHVLCTPNRGSLECWCLYRTAEQRLRWNWPRTHIAACHRSQAASNRTVSLRKSALLLWPMLCVASTCNHP